MAFQTFFKAPRKTAEERQAERRDRHGWRTAAKRNKFGGQTKAGERLAAHHYANAVKAETRRLVWLRSDVCECCGDTERETARKHHKASHEMHEYPTRAMTRGKPAEERFNVRICQRLCVGCHRLYQRSRLRSWPLTVEGFEGAYDVQKQTESGEWETVLTVDRRRAS